MSQESSRSNIPWYFQASIINCANAADNLSKMNINWPGLLVDVGLYDHHSRELLPINKGS